MKRANFSIAINFVLLGIFFALAGIWGYNTIFTEIAATPTNESSVFQTVKYDKSQDGQEQARQQTAVANSFPIIVDGRKIEYSALKVEINQETAEIGQLAELLEGQEVKSEEITVFVDDKELAIEDITASLTFNELRINGLSDTLGDTQDLRIRINIRFRIRDWYIEINIEWP